MIDENFELQEEERKLMMAVKKLQKKKQAALSGASSHVKKLTKTLDGRSHSPSKRHTSANAFDRSMASSANEFIMDMQNMRANLEESNRKVADLKTELDMTRRTTSAAAT